MQLVSDVPVGVFLSGGIDSSALVSILSRGGVTPSTFSIVFREAEFSEAEHSRAIAQQFRTDHHEITGFAAGCPGCDSPGASRHGSAHHGRRQYLLRFARNPRGGRESRAVRSGRRRGLRRIFQLSHRARAWSDLRGFWKNVPGPVRGSLASAFAALSPENDQNRKLASLAGDNGRVPHPYFLSSMLFTPGQRDLLFPSRGRRDTRIGAAIAAIEPAAIALARRRSIAFPIWSRAVICSIHCCATPIL